LWGGECQALYSLTTNEVSFYHIDGHVARFESLRVYSEISISGEVDGFDDVGSCNRARESNEDNSQNDQDFEA